MTPEQVEIDKEGLKKATRKGFIAFMLLAVLSLAEFYIAVNVDQPLVPLLPFVLLKGWIILDSFMHIRAVFTSEDH